MALLKWVMGNDIHRCSRYWVVYIGSGRITTSNNLNRRRAPPTPPPPPPPPSNRTATSTTAFHSWVWVPSEGSGAGPRRSIILELSFTTARRRGGSDASAMLTTQHVSLWTPRRMIKNVPAIRTTEEEEEVGNRRMGLS